MTKVDDWLEVIPSKHTRKNYVNGIKRFEEWYGKSITTLIKSPEATKTIEKFFVYLKQNHPQNTARNVTNAAIQFLKYFDTDVRPRRALGIYKTEKTTKRHRLTLSEVQRMAEVSSLKEQVVLETLLLGWRIGDVIRLKKADFDVLEQEAPIPLKIRASKEGTLYESFISQEFKDLLELYMPTIKGKWLFPGSELGGHTKDKTLNRLLQKLAKRANIRLHGSLTWHCGRKLVYSTGAALGIPADLRKKLIGKSVHHSDDTYLEVELKEQFLKIHEVLRLKPPTSEANGKISDIEETINHLEKTYDELHVSSKRLLKAVRILAKKMERGGYSQRADTMGLQMNYDKLSDEEFIEEFLKTSEHSIPVPSFEEDIILVARSLIKRIEQEGKRPFGAMLGKLAKGEVTEREYLEQFLKEEWGQKKRRMRKRRPSREK